MRVFNAFMLCVVAAMLWMLPFTEAIYDFRTYVREETFLSGTGVGTTCDNVTLIDELYNDDTSAASASSNLTTDAPLVGSYNSTSRQLEVCGLSSNSTRLLTVSYDASALVGFDAIGILLDRYPFIWILVIISLPLAGLFAIFTGMNY